MPAVWERSVYVGGLCSSGGSKPSSSSPLLRSVGTGYPYIRRLMGWETGKDKPHPTP